MNNDGLLKAIGVSNSILVVMGENPSMDLAGAALGMGLLLNKNGKRAKVVCPSQMTAGLSRLVGVDKVEDRLGGKNLVISFAVPEEVIEKVSYNYDGGKLNFVVEPAAGHTAPNKNQVNFSYSGIDADLVVIIGADEEMALGKFVQMAELANHANKHSLLELSGGVRSSYSVLVLELAKALEWGLDEDIATNLMMGIDSATANLSRDADAETLEAAAMCMRAGARRSVGENRQIPNQGMNRQNMGRRFVPPLQPRVFGGRPRPAFGNTRPPQIDPLMAIQPQAEMVSDETEKPEEDATQVGQPRETVADDSANQTTPAADWFEPKIYKGSSLL